VLAAYGALASSGKLMKPYVVDRVVFPNGETLQASPRDVRTVLSERAATIISGMLVKVVEDGHAKRAKVPGYYLAGKTGTAQVPDYENGGYSDKSIHTFVGFGPVENPRFVMLVRLDDPKDVRFAEGSAVPLFGQIAQFLLNYLEIKPSYEIAAEP
jgi:cell division protein FtsI (penicillin-binding protein 3)/stage V sporulation protein D (sporulation-specific penicillin-binding protein)